MMNRKKQNQKPIEEPLRRLLVEHQSRLEADAQIETGETNETNRVLLNQLFVMAGGIITLSSPIFTERTVLSGLPLYLRHALVGTILAAVASLGFGFAQLYIERRYFQRSKNLKFDASDRIGHGRVRSIPQLRRLYDDLKRRTGKSSSDLCTWAQFVTLGGAAVGFVVVMAYILLTAK